MIAVNSISRKASASEPAIDSQAHDRFMTMLPAIERHARRAVAHLSPESREDAFVELVAGVFVAYARLVERGLVELAYPAVLVGFALRHFRDGRRVGSRQHAAEALSTLAQRRGGFWVESIDACDGAWQEALLEDRRRTPVAELAAFRVDFRAWLKGLSRQQRRAVELLALGNGTGEVACALRVSPGRVSQLRRELAASWATFQGPPEAARPRAHEAAARLSAV